MEGLPKGLINEHVFLEGHVSWHKEKVLEERGIPSGDYHEWFEIKNIAQTAPVLKSKLNFNGLAGAGNFITLPSVCSSNPTSYIEVESWAGEKSSTQTHPPLGVEGCNGSVPFKPELMIRPETALSDVPDGARTELTLPQYATSTNTADLKDIEVTLPEELTLNPAAVRGLETCSTGQIAIVACTLAAYGLGRQGTGPRAVVFQGMFIADNFTFFCQWLFLVITGTSALISLRFNEREAMNRGEYYALLLFASSGMSLMAASGSGKVASNSSWETLPIASSRDQPYICSAPRFQNRMVMS